MDRTPKRPFRGSVDGFIVPQVKQVQRVRPAVPNVSVTPRPLAGPPRPPVPPKSPQPELPRYYSTYSQKKASAARGPQPKKRWTRKRKVITSTLTALCLLIGVGAWYGSSLIANLDKAFHGNIFSDVHAIFSSTKLKGEDQGRVNILLAGDSADDPNHAGANLTDSIMIVSIDTRNHTGFLLSVPRDMWVDVPGWGHEKINAANEVTGFNQAGYPRGGMGQLQQIVQTDLGIPIDYYALIDYSAFKQAVDTVGGISINIQSPDPRGIYDAYTHLKLPNGLVNLSGQEALDLARARGDNAAGDVSYGLPQSDFDRTQHQRQMLQALVQKAQSAGVLGNPIKVSQLFSAFGNNVHTDLNLQDVLRFIQITKGMNITHLQSISYSYGGKTALLSDYTSPDGQESLIPSQGLDDFGQLQQYYQQLTSNNPVVREAPSVVVLNGSNITGLAHKESVTLSSEGFNVVGVQDATSIYPTSMIIDNTNGQKHASKQLLQTILPRDTVSTSSNTTPAEATEAQGYNANFVIVLGSDVSNVQQP